MAKAKLRDFKNFIQSMDEKELQAEMLRLFRALPRVQEFYAQELMSKADRKKILAEYQKKLRGHFWTRGGMPKHENNRTVRKLLTDFERIAVDKADVVDLLITHIETQFERANEFGGDSDGAYNASYTSYAKAMKIMAAEKLEPYFRDRCIELTQYDNMDYWPIQDVEDLNYEYLKL